jgi:Flp pilus assembly protein CpaB
MNSTALNPGDHVDVLLTAPITTGAASDRQSNTLSTQTTLQNIEIYRIGDDELDVPPPNKSTDGSSGGFGSNPAPAASQSGRKAIGLLVDHQDAVTVKFVKDAGGTIDLVTRSAADEQIVRTEGVTLDSLTDRFNFRIPQSVQRAVAARQSP